jgi:hypothetical protein
MKHKLCNGAYGEIWVAVKKSSNTEVAVKIQDREPGEKELGILKRLSNIGYEKLKFSRRLFLPASEALRVYFLLCCSFSSLVVRIDVSQIKAF